MKYLIEDNEKIENSKLIEYFQDELGKTNHKAEDIVVSKPLRRRLAMIEIERILSENDINPSFYLITKHGIELKGTGYHLAFSKNELKDRFENVLNVELGAFK